MKANETVLVKIYLLLTESQGWRERCLVAKSILPLFQDTSSVPSTSMGGPTHLNSNSRGVTNIF